MDLGVNVVRLTRQFTGVGRYIECVLAEWSRMDLPFDEVILYAHSYDTIAERHPQLIFSSRTSRCLWSLKAWSAQRQADLIVTVSDFAHSCLVKQWNLNPEKVRVIQEAAAPIFKPDKAPERLDDILCELGVSPPLPYLMHVGGLSPHKNLEFLIDVFADVLAKPEHSLLRLLLVGDYAGDGFYSSLDSIRERIERRQVSSQVILTGYVSDSDLVHLYNGALALMYLSYEEGFGLPAVEAMSCGLPVIASRAGSLPEVIEAAGLFFEPGNRRELRARIEAILDDAVLRSNLGKKSLERSARVQLDSVGSSSDRDVPLGLRDMKARSLRICMLTTFYPPYNFGGDGIFVEHLVIALRHRGHHVEIIHSFDAYRFLGGKMAYQSPPPRVHTLRSPFPRLSLLFCQQTGRAGVYGAQIRRVIQEGAFDVLHFHNTSLIGGPSIVQWGQGLKLYTAHEYWLICPTHNLWRFNRGPCEKKRCLACTIHCGRPPQLWRYTRTLATATDRLDALLCPSRFCLNRHRRDGIRGTLVHLPHFVPVPAETHRDPDCRPYFLVVGRLEKLKGFQILIPVFACYPEAELWIVGTGSCEGELRRLARGQNRVRFLGRKSSRELKKLYRNAQALIVPSLCYETFGLVILEAFAQETPVIARDLGSLPELIEGSGGGFLYSSEEELRAAMERVQKQPDLRDRLGRLGRKALLQEWSEGSHISRYLGLIHQLMDQR